MKLIIDVPKETYTCLKNMVKAECVDPYSLADIIVNKSKPYEEQPHAEWLYFEGVSTSGYLECSKCGASDFRKSYFNYCPNCGSDMRKGNTKQ